MSRYRIEMEVSREELDIILDALSRLKCDFLESQLYNNGLYKDIAKDQVSILERVENKLFHILPNTLRKLWNEQKTTINWERKDF